MGDFDDYQLAQCGDIASIAEGYSLNTSDENLMAAHNQAHLFGAHAFDYIQNNGGNYYSIQTQEVSDIKVEYTLGSTYDSSLASAHMAGYYWRSSNPNKPLPPKP